MDLSKPSLIAGPSCRPKERLKKRFFTLCRPHTNFSWGNGFSLGLTTHHLPILQMGTATFPQRAVQDSGSSRQLRAAIWTHCDDHPPPHARPKPSPGDALPPAPACRPTRRPGGLPARLAGNPDPGHEAGRVGRCLDIPPAATTLSTLTQERLSLEARRWRRGKAPRRPGLQRRAAGGFRSGSVLSFLRPTRCAHHHIYPHSLTVSSALCWSSRRAGRRLLPSDMGDQDTGRQSRDGALGRQADFVPRPRSTAPARTCWRASSSVSEARPQSEQDAWKAAPALVSAALTVGLLAFLWFQVGGQRKSLKFISPSRLAATEDLVGWTT